MLTPNVLHSRGSLKPIPVLIAKETKTLSDKVALKRATWRIHEANKAEAEVLTRRQRIIIRIDTPNVLDIRVRGCRDCSRARQNREVISEKRSAGNARLWNRVRALEVQTTRKLTDEVWIEG